MSAFEEAQAKLDKRWGEIKHLSGKFTITRTPGYAHFSYVAVTTDPEAAALSASDVALIADNGNLCFGGRGWSKSENGDVTRFSGNVHTD